MSTDTYRIRPRINVSLNPDIMAKINEYASKTKWAKSRIIEMCVRFGMDKFEKSYLTMSTESINQEKLKKQNQPSKGEQLADAFMRNTLSGNDPRWQSV